MRDAFLGVTRFEECQRRLGIARNVLSARLDVLVEAGHPRAASYQAHPPRDEYVLTRKGSDLAPVLDAMRVWGDRYAAPDGPPALLVHDDCGEVTDAGGALRALRRTAAARSRAPRARTRQPRPRVPASGPSRAVRSPPASTIG